MLLSRIRYLRPRVRAFSTCSKLSNVNHSYPSSRIRAFPFAISKEEAILILGPYASQTCAFKNFIGSIGANLLPGSGFTPIQPSRLQPIYFPAWFVDAEVEVDTWVENKADKKLPATAFISDAYMPGFAFEPLSKISFNNPMMKEYDPVPFSKDLEIQHGSQILCLPFNISPLPIPGIALSLTDKQVEIGEKLRVDPKSIKVHFLAAYPVLIPLYLAQYNYEVSGKSRSATVILEAFSSSGRVISETGIYIDDDERDHVLDWLKAKFDNSEAFEIWRGEDAPFAKVDNFICSIENPCAELDGWLDGHIRRSGSASRLLRHCPADLSDPKVREYTDSEVFTNRSWMAMGIEIQSLKLLKQGLLQVTQVDSDQSEPIITGPVTIEDVPEALDSLNAHLEILEQKRAKATPLWWQELGWNVAP